MKFRFGFIVLVLIMTASLIFFWSDIKTSNEKIIDNAAGTSVEDKKQTAPTVLAIDSSWGEMNAKTTIVQFSDFTCPYCREAHAVLEAVMKQKRNIKIVWKDLPNDNHHPLSTFLARAGRCAQKINKFKTFHDWTFANIAGLDESIVKAYLKNLGLPDAEACLVDQSTIAKVERTIAEAVALGIDGTPYLFINNQPYHGEITVETMEKNIK